jgi:hypothetical protein
VDAPDLSSLGDEQYTELVTGNINPRTRDAAVWEVLTAPDYLERTREALNRVNHRTASSMRRRKTEREAFHQECRSRGEAGKREWFNTRPEYEDWRRKAAFFHQTVLAAISELTKLNRDRNRADNRRNRDESRETLRKLATAVNRHQAAHAKSGQIAAQEDYELWQLLDRLTVPCGPNQEPTTLRTMLDFYWVDVEVTTESGEAQSAAEKAMRQAPAGRSATFSGMPKARHVGNDKGLAG